MKASILTLLSFLFVFSIQVEQASAQDMKIGFVEPRAILERMPEMSALRQQLQNFAERKSNELAEMERNLERQIESYQQRLSVISDNARQQEEQRLGQLDLELRQAQTQAQTEMQQRQMELMEPLLEQMQNSISEVARSRDIDYVLNARTSTGDVIILYVKQDIRSEYDITDAVMRNLGI